jgi:uncharacterized membrane protein YhaH (DUF805 family)
LLVRLLVCKHAGILGRRREKMRRMVSATPPSFSLAERMPPRRMFFSLDGRISRRDFWLYGVLALLGLAVLGHALLGIARVHADTAERIVNLLLVWPALAVSVKRWHDRDKSGWWVLINLVPVIGWLWALIDNGLLRGTPGPNRYGEDPLADDRDQ